MIHDSKRLRSEREKQNYTTFLFNRMMFSK
jgi:hypothetical protein